MINKYKIKKLKSYRIRKRNKNIKLNRLTIHRTSKHIYAQIFLKNTNIVKICASTLDKEIKDILYKKNIYSGNKIASSLVGEIIAKRSIKENIYNVFLDRSGLRYHGRIKSFADSARKFGLIF